MDTQKDIQKSDTIGRFLNNFSPKTNPFAQNRIGERAYKRAERIAAAIVLLTNHVPESDPIRNTARSLCLSLIGGVLAVRDEMRTVSSNQVAELKVAVRHLISLVRLLAVAGHVSIQNAESVTEALDGLVEFIQASQKSNLAESIFVSREDLLDVRDTLSHVERTSNILQKDNTGRVDGPQNVIGALGPLVNDRTSNISSRTLSILEILRSGKGLGIREIASNLPEYSEKMIQRELADMVRIGRVKKEGLKRWSKYSIL